MTTNDVHPGSAVLSRVDVAVVGVAAARSHRAEVRTRSPWEAMEDYAAMICDRTALHAVRLPLATADVNTVIARVLSLQPRISAAFVVGLDAPAATAVQHGVAERGGPLVVTEIDVVTATLTAMTISALRNLVVGPRVGQVVITGAHRAPMLGPTLLMSGVAGISSWRTSDLRREQPGVRGVAIDVGAAIDDLADHRHRRMAHPPPAGLDPIQQHGGTSFPHDGARSMATATITRISTSCAPAPRTSPV